MDESHSDLWVSCGDDKLIIHLSEKLYNIYFSRKESSKAELIALLTKPAILSALQTEIIKVRNSDDEDAKVDVESRRWLRKLDRLIEIALDQENIEWDINKVKIDGDRDSNTLTYAVGVLLKHPLAKALEAINRKRN